MLVPAADGADGEERLVVMDFGLARQVSTDMSRRSSTATSAPCGTPRYMAPEQFEGRRATRATDVYAMAAVVHEMVTGRRVFEAGSEPTLDLERPDDTAPVPHQAVALLPSWRSAILRGVDRNPEARFETVGELLNALSRPDSAARWWPSVAGMAALGLGLALLVSIPTVRTTLTATGEKVRATLSRTQQSVAEGVGQGERRPSSDRKVSPPRR